MNYNYNMIFIEFSNNYNMDFIDLSSNIFSNTTIKTLQQGVNMFTVINKDTRTMLILF